MALKPVEPRGRHPDEIERYERDMKSAKENPHLWANGPEHVPEVIYRQTMVTQEVGAPPQATAASPAAPPRPLPAQPGVGIVDGRVMPIA